MTQVHAHPFRLPITRASLRAKAAGGLSEASHQLEAVGLAGQPSSQLGGDVVGDA